MGSSGGVVGHGGDRGKASLSHDVHGPTGMLVDCGVHEGDGADDFGKAVTCSKDTHGQGKMAEGLIT